MKMQMQVEVRGVSALEFTPDSGEPVAFGELHILEPLDTRRGDAAGDRTTVVQCDLALARDWIKAWRGPVQAVLDLENVTDRKGRRLQVCVGARAVASRAAA